MTLTHSQIQHIIMLRGLGYSQQEIADKINTSQKTVQNYLHKFKNESKKIKEGNMEKYKCSVCEYIYDPKKGDPDSGIVPGTSFIDFGVFTASTTNGRKLLVLHIENFGKCSSSGSKLVSFIIFVTTLYTSILSLIHMILILSDLPCIE